MWGVNDGHRLSYMERHWDEITGWFQIHHRWRWTMHKEIEGTERLGEEVVGGPPLQGLNQATGCHLRRPRPEEVDVVPGHMPFEKFHLLLPADLPDELADPEADLAPQDRLAVLGHPHEVQVDHEHGVGPMAVVHAAILPQALEAVA